MIYDVTLVIRTRMPVFPGEPAPQVVPIKRMADGDKSNVSELRMSLTKQLFLPANYTFMHNKNRTFQAASRRAILRPAQLAD